MVSNVHFIGEEKRPPVTARFNRDVWAKFSTDARRGILLLGSAQHWLIETIVAELTNRQQAYLIISDATKLRGTIAQDRHCNATLSLTANGTVFQPTAIVNLIDYNFLSNAADDFAQAEFEAFAWGLLVNFSGKVINRPTRRSLTPELTRHDIPITLPAPFKVQFHYRGGNAGTSEIEAASGVLQSAFGNNFNAAAGDVVDIAVFDIERTAYLLAFGGRLYDLSTLPAPRHTEDPKAKSLISALGIDDAAPTLVVTQPEDDDIWIIDLTSSLDALRRAGGAQFISHEICLWLTRP